jgi:acyl-CoA thioesterase FadM
MESHREKLTVRRYETGPGDTASVQTVCNYMEEAAANHACMLGFGLDAMREKNLTWVLAKMRIQFHGSLHVGEEATVETWPVDVERLQFRRDFLFHGADGTIPVRAVTRWAVMDIASRRLERMPAHMAELMPKSPRLALENGDIRFPPAGEESAPGPSFRVRLADIDQNRHVNNVRYIDFLLEAATVFGVPGNTLRRLDIMFRSETLWGDTVSSSTQPDPETPGTLLHSLHRDGREIIRARTVWT